MRAIDEIIQDLRRPGYTPRSSEYWAGAKAALQFRLTGKSEKLPYLVASAQADAYFSGPDRGHSAWRAEKEGEQE